ncbi:MAG: flippase-like domain-containing protein [Thermoplasmata archaeon]|nr:flippase-like domain-containing protein [Thermoplasmata archaeon]
MGYRISKIKYFLPLIGVVLFIYIVYSVGPHKIIYYLSRINILYLIASLSIFIPRITITTYKWQMIAKKQGIFIPLSKMIKINLIGLFYGTITPLWVGDFIRVFYLHQESDASLGKCTANFVMDQLIELFCLFTLSMIGSIIIASIYPLTSITIFVVFLIITASILILKKENNIKKIFKLIYNTILPEKYKELMKNEFEEFYNSILSIKELIIPYLIELFSYSLFFVQIYIIALGMSINIPMLDFIFLYAIAALIGQIPITVSGLGTRESALITLFSLYGVEASKVVALSLTGYIITFLLPSIAGMIYSFRLKFK